MIVKTNAPWSMARLSRSEGLFGKASGQLLPQARRFQPIFARIGWHWQFGSNVEPYIPNENDIRTMLRRLLLDVKAKTMDGSDIIPARVFIACGGLFAEFAVSSGEMAVRTGLQLSAEYEEGSSKLSRWDDLIGFERTQCSICPRNYRIAPMRQQPFCMGCRQRGIALGQMERIEEIR